jgi:hypothetical protein
VSDAVAVDAKRILLRYGAPISVLDKVSDSERIEFARTISRTPLADREVVLQRLLVDLGYMEPKEVRGGKGSRSHKGGKATAGTGKASSGNGAGAAAAGAPEKVGAGQSTPPEAAGHKAGRKAAKAAAKKIAKPAKSSQPQPSAKAKPVVKAAKAKAARSPAAEKAAAKKPAAKKPAAATNKVAAKRPAPGKRSASATKAATKKVSKVRKGASASRSTSPTKKKAATGTAKKKGR